MYITFITNEVLAACAIVRLGYASKAFFFAYDIAEKKMGIDASILKGPFAAKVARVGADEKDREHVASFGSDARITREANGAFHIVTRFAKWKVDAVAHANAKTNANTLTAIAHIPSGLVNVTEKGALIPASGTLTIPNRTYTLDGGLMGYDHTSGILARHTSWRWAFAMGKDVAGAPFALNLTQGFVGETECAMWSNGDLHALTEPRFFSGTSHDPWRVESTSGKLLVRERARHVEKDNLLVVRSRFIQCVGDLEGKLTTSSHAVNLKGVPCVVEDQDVLW
jgi:hypothetical protein